MATKNLIPRADGEGGIGIASQEWGEAYFKTGKFTTTLTLGGNPVITSANASSLTITASQISDLGAQGFLTAEANDLSSAVVWANVPDANVTSTSVVQHQADLSITASQISDLGAAGFLTTETNDLSSAVVWANVPDANVASSSIVQHQADLSINTSQVIIDSHLIPNANESFDIGSANFKIRDLYLSDNSLNIGDASISATNTSINFPAGISLGGVGIGIDAENRVTLGTEGLKIGEVELKPDPDNPKSLFFNEIPQVKDAEGNAVTVLTADKLGLGTSAALTGIDTDIKFKLLTDQNRFVVGTSGDYGLASGWYRFNDFKVKGATDIGYHSINPVDTRIYSDESSFILFTQDDFGNRVAHLVGGDEQVNASNNIALGLAIKVDSADSPSDIEFVHTDGESYSVINGDSDSKGANSLPIRQGFQNPSLGANPSPLLIDGGSF